jgi:hypothetical protein
MAIYLKEYKSNVPNTFSLELKIELNPILLNKLNNKNPDLLKKFSRLFFWDFGKQASEYLKVNDEVFILTSKKLYFGKITYLFKDKYGSFGDSIGWSRNYNAPWENPVGFESIVESDKLIFANSYSKEELIKKFYQLKLR